MGPAPLTRLPLIESALVFLGFCALGLASMAPTTTFGDAGEFTASAAVLGLSHAPSYPLHALLGKALGTALPWGNWAYRTNLLSVLAAAAPAALLAEAGKAAGLTRLSRLAGVCALALVPLWRYEAAVTEVFAVHVLALSGLLFALCRWGGKLSGDRPMAALGLCTGLGLSNHHTLVLAAPAVAWEVWRARSTPARLGRDLLVFTGFLLVGLLLYLYLPVRSSQGPPLDWGHPVDLDRFLWVLLRRDYGSLSLTVDGASGRSLIGALAQVSRYLKETAAGLGWPFLSLAALGLAAWPSLGLRPSTLSLALWTAAAGPAFLILGSPPFDAQTSSALERFYLASWLPLGLLAAAGFEELGRRWRPAAAAAAVALLLQAGAGRQRWWVRGDLAAYDYGRSLLRSLPRGATLFIDGGDDTFYSLAYLKFAEDRRGDLELHDRGGLVFKSVYGSDFRTLTRAHKEARRLEVERGYAASGDLFYSTLNERLMPGMVLEPWGLLRRAQAGAARPQRLWELYPRRWEASLFESHYRDRALAALYPVMRASDDAARGELSLALKRLRQAEMLAPDALWLQGNLPYVLSWLGYESSRKADWKTAEQAFLRVRALAPDSAEGALSLGVVYEKTGRLSEAERLYLRAQALAPAAAKSYQNLGTLYWGQGRWRQCAEMFDRAAALSPSDPSSARFAAQARLRLTR